jgi:O-antigen/teichoic acid export membrane protein
MFKIISAIVLFYPLLAGIIVLISSFNIKFKKIARYKEDNDYKYINRLYAKTYIVLGWVVFLFGNLMNYFYPIFSFNRMGPIIAFLVAYMAKSFMDVLVNVRLQVDEMDRKEKENNQDD